MEMPRHRSYRFLLQPTTRQRQSLVRLLVTQCELYNAALEERRGAWRHEQRSIGLYDQYKTLTTLREARPDVFEFGTIVCRGTLDRLDHAFKSFYRRVKAGEAPGYPRFKSAARFDSASWPTTSGWKLDEDQRRFNIQGLGHIKCRPNQQLRGEPRTCTVKREGRRWYLTVVCINVPARALEKTGEVTGVDLGIVSLAVLSNGEQIENPRFAKHTQGRLASAQRSLALKKRGSKRRRRAVERVAAAHRKVANQRRDHLHKVSRDIVDRFDLIAHEDLKIKSMTRRPKPRPDGGGGYEPNGAAAKSGLNKSIHDAGWGTLLGFITYKAEEAGREVVAVDPRHTSQRCYQCGHTCRENRVTQAEFCCVSCGHIDHADVNADVNAAKNILRAGLALHSSQKCEASS